MNEMNIKDVVREKYAEAARRVTREGRTSCCGPAPSETDSGCGCGGTSSSAVDLQDPVTRDLYTEAEKAGLPTDAVAASLGCGNPTALAELTPGEDVLDLGSGGGIDVLLSARRVAPGGTAYGLDMTDEMLELARRNQRQAGVENAVFLKGEIENIPLPDASVDVIISNCVINLSVDKGRVLREAFRVLRPGGRFAVSDIVLRGELPPTIQKSLEMWAGCVAGALQETEYLHLLAEAGFEAIDIEPTRVYEAGDAKAFLSEIGVPEDEIREAEGRIMAAFVRATKPA
jgi:arsenite methyltransferase